jgi:outer membrane immunogenic protein
MNKILLGSVALAALLAGPAMAADMGVPRAAYVPPPSWTGFYVGGNFGGVWGNTNPGLQTGCLPGELRPGSPGTNPNGGVVPNLPSDNCYWTFGSGAPTNISVATQIGTQPFHNNGWTGGGQIGFNYQYQWAVFGIEADFQAFRPKGSQNVVGIYPVVNPAQNCGNSGAGCQFGFTQSSDGKWLTTVRGRVGAVWGNFMVYGTMGVAWVKTDFTSNFADTTTNQALTNGGLVSNLTVSRTKAGPVGGAGLSYMFMRNIIVSVEYLRLEIWDAGDNALALPTNTVPGAALGRFRGNFHYDTSFQENIVRGKIDYKF